MKKLISNLLLGLGFSCFAGAQTVGNIGADWLLKPHASVLVVSSTAKSLYVHGNASVTLDGLAGQNVTTNSPALGGALNLHYSAGPVLSGVLGLGCTYDTSKSFQLSDISTRSVGLVFGFQVDVLALVATGAKRAVASALGAYHVIDSDAWH